MLDYVALGILIFAAVTLFYGIIAIHDIPYEIATNRNHPHQDAIQYAGWVSLFTLHAIWPLLWIWAAIYRDDRGWGFSQTQDRPALAAVAEQVAAAPRESAPEIDPDITDSVTLLQHKYEALDDRIDRIEKAIMAAGDAATA